MMGVGKADVIWKLAEKSGDDFFNKEPQKTCMARMYETKRIIVARFLVRNSGFW